MKMKNSERLLFLMYYFPSGVLASSFDGHCVPLLRMSGGDAVQHMAVASFQCSQVGTHL